MLAFAPGNLKECRPAGLPPTVNTAAIWLFDQGKLSSMTPDRSIHLAEEVELTLALPVADPSSLARRLGRIPLLARRKVTHLHCHNVYFDTPAQLLRHEHVALRLRRIDGDGKGQWLQTLEMPVQDDSALGRHAEWEVSVLDAALALTSLKETPWSAIDPDGAVFRALEPCFATTFDRTCWLVRRRDGSVIEVALDVGQIAAGGRTAPICELKLELLSGQPAALFDIAQKIAGAIAVLPENVNKAERGYALAQDALEHPIGSRPARLTSKRSLPDAAQQVMRETFRQFTSNLNTLRTSDDPEVVHRARVGWRRFKSAWRLFRSSVVVDAVPSWQPLQPLLTFLSELRDLDVARIDTLPPLAETYAAGDSRRADEWQALADSLRDAANVKRKEVRYALQVPTVGATLLATIRWLEEMSVTRMPGIDEVEKRVLPLRRWANRRMVRLHKQLNTALKQDETPDTQHRVRILSKRMRYDIEALRPLLPKKRTQRWYQQATRLQTTLGATRDVHQASLLASRLEIGPGPVEFLRGVAVGRERPRRHG